MDYLNRGAGTTLISRAGPFAIAVSVYKKKILKWYARVISLYCLIIIL